MNRIKKYLETSLFCFFMLFAGYAFAEVNILSPASSQSRVWSNKQVLVVNATEGEDIFYSITGSDPLTSGFAYDEPVALDVAGNVELRVACINKNKVRTDYILKFKVEEKSIESLETIEEKEFIKMMNSNSVYEIKCGEEVRIPETFEYCISSNNVSETMESGRPVSVTKDSNLERYVSLTVKSKNNDVWNYVLHVIPESQGELSKAVVPFEIIEWSKIYLKDKNFIYSIDDDWWQGYGKTVNIDRSVPHTIKWQNIDYDASNPVQCYDIPPTPVLRSEFQEDATLILTLDGDESYRFAKSKKSQSFFLPEGLHKTIHVDAFQGENFITLMPVDVYSGNVYQGSLFSSIQVNRKHPPVPEIYLNNDAFVCRSDVTFSLKAKSEEDEIKYFVWGPYKLSHEEVVNFTSKDVKFDPYSYKDYDGKNQTLTATSDQPVLYKIFAYSIDKWNNTSDVAIKDVYINKCDYFINSSAKIDGDGTPLRPFNSLSQIEELSSKTEFVKFYISGKHKVNKSIKFKNNVQISGDEDSEIVFGPKGSVYISNASLAISNMRFTSNNLDKDGVHCLMTFENGTSSINTCEFSFGTNKTATLINSIKSSIKINDSGLTSFASGYACVISSIDSKINVVDSRITTVADTNVCFSGKKTTFNLTGNNCSSSGVNSRSVELLNSKAVLTNNHFAAKDIQTKIKNNPIWKDENSRVEEAGNRVTGF